MNQLTFICASKYCNADCTYLCNRREAAKLGRAALSGDDKITTTQSEAYKVSKLGYKYEDVSGHRNAEYACYTVLCLWTHQ